jgi:hypothetical protein
MMQQRDILLRLLFSGCSLPAALALLFGIY